MISLEQFNSLGSKNGVVQICNDQKTELSADNEDKWRKIDEHDLAQNNIYIRSQLLTVIRDQLKGSSAPEKAAEFFKAAEKQLFGELDENGRFGVETATKNLRVEEVRDLLSKLGELGQGPKPVDGTDNPVPRPKRRVCLVGFPVDSPGSGQGEGVHQKKLINPAQVQERKVNPPAAEFHKVERSDVLNAPKGSLAARVLEIADAMKDCLLRMPEFHRLQEGGKVVPGTREYYLAQFEQAKEGLVTMLVNRTGKENFSCLVPYESAQFKENLKLFQQVQLIMGRVCAVYRDLVEELEEAAAPQGKKDGNSTASNVKINFLNKEIIRPKLGFVGKNAVDAYDRYKAHCEEREKQRETGTKPKHREVSDTIASISQFHRAGRRKKDHCVWSNYGMSVREIKKIRGSEKDQLLYENFKAGKKLKKK